MSMRKTILLFSLFFLLIGCTASLRVQAFADSPPPNARTTTDGVVFYRTTENPYFVLFKGYYLDLTNEVTGLHYKAYYHSNERGYARLTGYVLISDVESGNIKLVSEEDTDYYPIVSLVTKIDVGLSSEAAQGTFFVPIDKDKAVFYYGSKTGSDGNLWHYVMYDSFRGYLPHFAVDVPNIPEHPSLNPPLPEIPEAPPVTNNTPQNDYLKWIMILGISVPALIIVVLLFKPRKAQPASRIPSFMEEFDELDDF